MLNCFKDYNDADDSFSCQSADCSSECISTPENKKRKPKGLAMLQNIKQPSLLVIQDDSTLAIEPNMKKVKEESGIKNAVNVKDVFRRQNLGGENVKPQGRHNRNGQE